MQTFARCLSAVSVLAMIGSAYAFTVTPFNASVWPRSDASLGIGDCQIEDFEDRTLVPGLQVELSGGTDNYAPTSTLPRTFDPSTDDPNAARVFTSGVWDGDHVLLNRRTVPPSNYSDFAWGNITFHMKGGASLFGFSLQQFEVGAAQAHLLINGDFHSFLNAHLATTSGRNGYLRITAGPGETIKSVTIDNGVTSTTGDGLAFDHVALCPVSPLDIGGSVTGFRPTRVTCLNVTKERRVVIQDGARAWNCEAEGFTADSGDTIQLTIRGIVD